MSDPAYWPWWLGGLTLAAVAVSHVAASGRLLTVSGILSRALRWREDERDRQKELELARGGLDDELLAATLEQFGGGPPGATESAKPAESVACESSPVVRLRVSAGATFIAALVVGGFVSALGDGRATLGLGLGPEFGRVIGGGFLAVGAALGGGFLVGFGARMAGGCTSGHGLCGMGRMQVGSLAATCAFFAGGIVVSFLLRSLA